MKNKTLFVALMVLAWGGVIGFRVYGSMQHAEAARQALAGQPAFTAQVLAVDAGGRRGANAAVRLRTAKNPAGGDQPATLSVSHHNFVDVDALKTGAAVEMVYNPATQDATERQLLEKQSRWTYWLLE